MLLTEADRAATEFGPRKFSQTTPLSLLANVSPLGARRVYVHSPTGRDAAIRPPNRDPIGLNRIMISSLCLIMISGQTLSVWPRKTGTHFSRSCSTVHIVITRANGVSVSAAAVFAHRGRARFPTI
jgi:hypothetical protein